MPERLAQATDTTQEQVPWWDRTALHAALISIVLLAIHGTPALSSRRLIFLVALRKQWDDSYLPGDWMFSTPHYNHLVFNLLFGPLTLFLPLEAVHWIGMVGCWLLLMAGVFRLGRTFDVPRWLLTAGVVLWLIYDQAPVSHEYIFGSFESKGVAYIFLLFALSGLIEGRTLLPAAFIGLTFSFHAAVGMWGGLAAGVALILTRRLPVATLVKMGGLAALCALPGLLPLLSGVFGRASTPGEAEFLTRFLFPMHLDPMSWPKRSILALYVLLAFNVWQARSRDTAAMRFLLWFQASLGLVFTVGLVARGVEAYGLLRYFPFRLFPVFVTLFFFWHLAAAYHHSPAPKVGRWPALLGMLGLLTFGDPLGRLVDEVALTRAAWTGPEQDVQRAFRWVAANTPRDSLIIAPPWRKDAHYLTGRAQVATWEIYAHDRPLEWRQRVEALIGTDWERVSANDWNRRIEPMDEAYSRLTAADITRIVQTYGGDFLVSRADYPFPKQFEAGRYRVYALPRPAPAATPVP